MSHSRSLSLIFSVFILLALIFASAVNVSRVSAATIVVDSFEDNEIDDDFCTLREALIAANTDSPYRGCPAGNGADTITLPPGTYTLTSQLPNITTVITIDGDTAENTMIQASTCSPVTSVTPEGCTPASYRVFQINSVGTLTLNNLSIRHGNSAGLGGGILNYGSLTTMATIFTENAAEEGGGVSNINGTTTLVDSKVMNNKAANQDSGGGWGGGISNYQGTVTIINSTLSDNISSYFAGAAYNVGTMEMIDTTLVGNTARWGGGVLNSGSSTLNINNSTFSGNSVEEQGGGIYNNGEITVINSTFSGNIADTGGGIFANSGTVNLESSTIAENNAVYGAGVYIYSVLNFSNTLIANSINGADCYVWLEGSGSIGTNTHNLVGDGSCSVGGINFLSGDPKLGPLGNNGGPTQTHALLVDSPAIDKGNCALLPDTDQRGEPRPVGSACDIGAFEFSPEPIISMAITLEEPVIGEEPDTEADVVSDPMGAIAAPTANVTWDPPHAAFAYNQAYAITVVLAVADGYQYLDGSTMVSVNDQSPDSVTFDDIESTLTVVYTFDALIKDEISFIYLPLITR